MARACGYSTQGAGLATKPCPARRSSPPGSVHAGSQCTPAMPSTRTSSEKKAAAARLCFRLFSGFWPACAGRTPALPIMHPGTTQKTALTGRGSSCSRVTSGGAGSAQQSGREHHRSPRRIASQSTTSCVTRCWSAAATRHDSAQAQRKGSIRLPLRPPSAACTASSGISTCASAISSSRPVGVIRGARAADPRDHY